MDAGALKFASKPTDFFKLKSGRMSPYFFNSAGISTGKSLTAFADALAHSCTELNPDVIFGPAYKGIPLATAVSMQLWINDRIEVGYAFNRKEAKDHGEGGFLTGHSLEGKRVHIVDDVITNGASKDAAIEFIREHGGITIGCSIGLDRQERFSDTERRSAGMIFEERHTIPLRAAATLTDVVEFLEQWPARGEGQILENLIRYREEFGAIM